MHPGTAIVDGRSTALRLRRAVGSGGEPARNQRVVPWVPLVPLKMGPLLAAGDTLFGVAVEQEVLQYAPRVKLLRVEKPEFDFLTFDEAERLVTATDPEWRTMVLLGLHTGLRRGELIALQWDALDLVAGRLLVKRNV